MTTVRILGIVGVCVVWLGGSALVAEDKPMTLTAQDRADIQKLVADYATFLGTCAAQDYARLFEPDGIFASGPRGSVSGRDRLVALVESERHCNGNGERRARPAPTVEIEGIPGGAAGKAILGNDGTYIDDTYVKTKNGWRFKLRQVITGQEQAATLAGQDFLAIRRLAGDGQYRRRLLEHARRLAFPVFRTGDHGYANRGNRARPPQRWRPI